jgi:hypothetical protein
VQPTPRGTAMKVRWIVEVRGRLRENKDSEEVVFLGPFSSEEEACDISLSMPADLFNVSVHPFMETEKQIGELMKDLTEQEAGQIMQTYFMVQEKMNARN